MLSISIRQGDSKTKTQHYEIIEQVAKRATIAHLRAIINLLGHFRCSRAANFTVSGPIWLKFDLIKDIMHVLITYKFNKYLINSNRRKVETSILDTQGQLTQKTHPSVEACSHYLQVSTGSDQKQSLKSGDKFRCR